MQGRLCQQGGAGLHRIAPRAASPSSPTPASVRPVCLSVPLKHCIPGLLAMSSHERRTAPRAASPSSPTPASVRPGYFMSAAVLIAGTSSCQQTLQTCPPSAASAAWLASALDRTWTCDAKQHQRPKAVSAGNLSELDEEEPEFVDKDVSGHHASAERPRMPGHWRGGSRTALPDLADEDSGVLSPDVLPEGACSARYCVDTDFPSSPAVLHKH